MNILTICPTKNRPEKCGKMLESFRSMTTISSIVFILDNDEKFISEYKEMLCEYNIEIYREGTVTDKINKTFEKYNDYDFYHITNDDFVYQTEEWDLKLIDKIQSKGGIGISYGNDLLTGQALPTAPMISANIVKALGWLQMPRLTHLYGDSVWKTIGHKLNILYYCHDVIIEHQHPQKDKKYKDSTFEYTNSKAMYQKDHQAFRSWVEDDYLSDIYKIKELIDGKTTD